MHITLIPQRRDDRLALHRTDDTLTINGVAYDFAALPEGATLPRAAVDCDWLVSDVSRIDGALHLALILPFGPGAPQETLCPAPLLVAGDGPVALPPYDLTPEDAPDAD
jgi:hypothetical protein